MGRGACFSSFPPTGCGEFVDCITTRIASGESIAYLYYAMEEIKLRKKILLVGDKVLLTPDRDQDRTEHGLYLPPGVKEKEKVQSGVVVQGGPGYAVPNPQYIDQESWSTSPKDPVKYIPLQAEAGDVAVFLRDAAIEIEYEGAKYFIVSHSSILMLVRRSSFEGLEPRDQ